MTSEAIPAKPASASRVSLAIITEPRQSNPFGTIHGGVILKLVDECGGIAALRHAGEGQITTAAIDSMMFLGPVLCGRAGRDHGGGELCWPELDRDTDRGLR